MDLLRYEAPSTVQDYVDTRSIWPTYIKGQTAVKMEGKPRSITIEDARIVARFLLGGQSI